MRHFLRMALIAWAAMQSSSALSADEAPKQPVPDANAIRESTKTVKEIFKDDYGKPAVEAKRAFAEQLFRHAREETKDLALQYVLLTEAISFAAQSNHFELVNRAIDDTAKVFAVDALQLKQSNLAKINIQQQTKEAAGDLFNLFNALIEEAVAKDSFDIALKFCASAEMAAVKMQSVPSARQMQARAREVRDLESESSRIKAAQQKILEKPDDPEANTIVGKYLCTFKNDWRKGLPMLAAGSPSSLKDLAAKELAGADDGAAKLAIADGWFDLAGKSSSREKQALTAHALEHYEAAYPLLNGLSKTKAGARLAQITGSIATRFDVHRFQPRFPITTNIPNELSVEGGATYFSIAGVNKNDAAVINGNLEGHFGKLVLLKQGVSPSAIEKLTFALVTKVPARQDHTTMFVYSTKNDADKPSFVKLLQLTEIDKTYTIGFKVNGEKMEVLLDGKVVGTIPVLDPMRVGVGVTVRYRGDPAELKIVPYSNEVKR